jgi:hypothetical protein
MRKSPAPSLERAAVECVQGNDWARVSARKLTLMQSPRGSGSREGRSRDRLSSTSRRTVVLPFPVALAVASINPILASTNLVGATRSTRRHNPNNHSAMKLTPLATFCRTLSTLVNRARRRCSHHPHRSKIRAFQNRRFQASPKPFIKLLKNSK